LKTLGINDAKDEKGNTQLRYFARYKDVTADAVKVLLGKGAEVKAKNKEGRTPRDLASQRSSDGLVKILLKLEEK
jgi:ankyrin repeat protein